MTETPLPISIIVLTFNAEATIAATLASAAAISDDVHVVDSYSTDRTLEIARAHGARIVEHPFEHYGAQRNWAIDTLALQHDWQLHLDADERLSDELATELRGLFAAGPPAEIAGYYLPRLVHFHRRPLRHGGMYPIYHLRLFRSGRGRCESRRYDQHFYVNGASAKLAAPMIDDIRLPLGEWTARHNRWADAEVDEIMAPSGGDVIKGGRNGDPVAEKRAHREWYYRQPMFLRALLLFLYRYIWKRGFLDGKEGLIFYVLQTFWFRFLIDAKLHERRKAMTKDGR
ncbi:MAG TPA: glycosyltransferase family 2 protein [Alphaproteobacteria bacterium]|nr:glycosyltransferase family 2 protein [Alphaproteobacteria bacterium]